MKKLQPFPGELTKKPGKRNSMTYVLTEEQEEWFRSFFPEVENIKLMKASGMSHSTLHRLARAMGLTKSEEGMNGIKKRQAAHIKKVCEKNGYYDTLRGVKPSDASIEGTRRMWQQIREGKRLHPIHVVKRNDIMRYNELMQKKSQQRKELIYKERRRELYCIERKTRLHLPVNRYTRSQISHRCNAINRGYIIVDDYSEHGGERYNIYFDGDTDRSRILERNLERDGFTVLAWPDTCEEEEAENSDVFQ